MTDKRKIELLKFEIERLTKENAALVSNKDVRNIMDHYKKEEEERLQELADLKTKYKKLIRKFEIRQKEYEEEMQKKMGIKPRQKFFLFH